MGNSYEPTVDTPRIVGNTYPVGKPFQRVIRIEGVTLAATARDPKDHASCIVPKATPVAPIHTTDDGARQGLWMPIRRSLIDEGANGTVVVNDAEPFAVGDVVHHINGATGAGTALGTVTAVDYDTDTITYDGAVDLTAATGWIEVTENGSLNVATDEWHRRRRVAMMWVDTDVRITCDSGGYMTAAAVVQVGAIWDRDVWFPEDPITDGILLWEFGPWCTSFGSVQIISERAHGDEINAEFVPNTP
ncbi:MAG: hypothetical protein PHZ19_01810 [Candidatus Thermoplasmatota archaeon]|nr:hypothetical protein [Candidatus Thermoplasmatota archaeon]